jgi:hypothetical protein
MEKQTKRDNATALLASMHRKRLHEKCNRPATTSANKQPLTSVETDDSIQIPSRNTGKRKRQLQSTGVNKEQDCPPLAKRSRIGDRLAQGGETGSRSPLLKDHNSHREKTEDPSARDL